MSKLLSLPPGYRWLVTLALVVLVVILSVTPSGSESADSAFVWVVATTPKPMQKLMHVGAYAGLAFLWAWTLEIIEARTVRFGLGLVLTIGLGIALEWYQTRVPGRHGTLLDIMLNGLGAVAGLLAALILL